MTHRSLWQTQSIFLSALFASLFATASAHAAGIEETVAGTVTLGRAANYGRATDFMAILQNPANLAIVPGGDLGGELRLSLFNACFDRARDTALSYREPDEASGFQGRESFANVCNSATPVPTGNLGWVQSFDNGLGWGIGFFTPAAVPGLKWGNDRIVTVLPAEDEQYPITERGVEYPTRMMLVERRALAGWLMLGVGYQPFKKLRIGASAGAGFFTIYNKNVASVSGGFASDPEILNEVRANDWFVPRATVSMVYAPTDAFEVFAGLAYQADVEATGHVDLTANGIRGAPRGDCRSESPGPYCRISGSSLSAPLVPLEATLGLRYAARRAGRERVLNPLKDELWDIALEAVWSQTSHTKDFVVKMGSLDEENPPQIQFSSGSDARTVGTPLTVSIPRSWKDTYAVRVGGDYNLIAEKLAVRLGLSYATNAVPTKYMNIDAFPVRKVGLHAGLTLAYGRSRLSLAYAHLFYQSITVPVGQGGVTEIVSQGDGLPINEGQYNAMFDVISVQSNLSF